MGTRPGESKGGVAPFVDQSPRPCPAATACEIVLTADPSRDHTERSPAHYSRARAPGRGSPRGRGMPCPPRRKSTSNLFENREDERGDMRGDPLEVRQDVEVDFRGLQRFGESGAQPAEV